jgi:UDP-N-acetylmuramate dehydrogenase
MANEQLKKELLRHVARIEDSYSLQSLNPLKAGGVSDFYTEAMDTVELAAAVKAAIDLKIPYVVVGQGSGVLFSDGGFPGLVIHNRSENLAIARDKSQVVADSGMSLQRLITAAANQGLGGLTHLFGQPGSIGGAVYANIGQESHPILSSVRYLTVLLPPARLDREATIARFRTDWMQEQDGVTKLQRLKLAKGVEEPQPILLSILFQMTNVRTDEVRLRLRNQSAVMAATVPRGEAMGPLFSALPDVRIEDLLKGAEVGKLRVGNVLPDRRHPNYLVGKGTVRSADIRQLIGEMQERVAARYSVSLACRYEYLGVW